MNEKTEKYMAIMLEGYERSLEGVSDYVRNTSQQLEAATAQRDEIVANIAELKDMLGIADEPEGEEYVPADETVDAIVADAAESEDSVAAEEA